MTILNFGILLLLCFSKLKYSFGKPINGTETFGPYFKNLIDSEIQNENWSKLCDVELSLDAMKKQLDDALENGIDVVMLKNYIVNQTGENYQEIQNACLNKNISTSILPPTSTTTEKL